MSTLTRLRTTLAAREPLPVPSMEDAVNAASDNTEQLNTADAIEGEIKTLTERYDIGNEYLDNSDGGFHIAPEEITAKELAAIQAMTKTMIEGVGVGYSEVMPSAESATGSYICLEALRDLGETFLKTIQRLLESLWSTILDYWKLFVTRIGSLVNTAKLIKDQVKDVIGRSPSKAKLTLTNPRYFNHFFNGTKHLGDFAALESAFQGLLDVGGSVYTRWGKDVLNAGNIVVDELSAANVSEIEPTLQKINQVTSTLWLSLDRSLKGETPLMGNTLLTYRSDWDEKLLTDQPVETARLIQTCALTLESRPLDVDITKLMFKTLTLNEINDLMDMIIRMGESLHRYLKSSQLNRLGQKSKEFVRRAEQNVGRGDNRLNESHYRNRLDITFRYAVKYGQWAKNPTLGLSKLMVEISRTIQMLANESLAVYQ